MDHVVRSTINKQEQVRQQDPYSANAEGGSYNYVQHPRPLFKVYISVAHCMPLYRTRLEGSRMMYMYTTVFQTTVRPPVTLIFDLLTPEVDRCKVLSLSDRRYSLNPLSQTRID